MNKVLSALVVTAPEAGQKIYQFLMRRFAAPPSVLHKWIRKGEVRLNGKRIKAFDRVALDDLVRVPPQAYYIQQEQEAAARVVEQGALPLLSSLNSLPLLPSLPPLPPLPSIVAEWEQVVFFNKPTGLAVHPGSGRTDSVTQRLAYHYKQASFLPAPVHRIDAETSGLLAVGTTYKSVRLLSTVFARQSAIVVEKFYLAWVYGAWKHDTCLLDDLFLREKQTVQHNGKSGFEQMQCVHSATIAVTLPLQAASVEAMLALESKKQPEQHDTIAAQSLVRCVATQQAAGQTFSLLCIQLVTGRTHQIRVQLAQRQHAVVGDKKYGRTGYKTKPNLLLHAAGLRFLDGAADNALLFQCQCLPEWQKSFTIDMLDVFAV